MKKIYLALFFIVTALMFGAGSLQDNLKTEQSMEEAMLADEKPVPLGSAVITVKGKAFIKGEKEESWKQIVKGMEVKEKTTIITLEGAGTKIALKTGTIIDIGEKTRAVFESLKEYPKKENLNETALKIFWGSVFSTVKKLGTGSKYEVKTGSATCGVRGTEFTVTSDPLGTTDLKVFSGEVQIAIPNTPEILYIKANEKVELEKGKFKPVEVHNDKPPKPTKEEEEEAKKFEEKSKKKDEVKDNEKKEDTKKETSKDTKEPEKKDVVKEESKKDEPPKEEVKKEEAKKGEAVSTDKPAEQQKETPPPVSEQKNETPVTTNTTPVTPETPKIPVVPDIPVINIPVIEQPKVEIIINVK